MGVLVFLASLCVILVDFKRSLLSGYRKIILYQNLITNVNLHSTYKVLSLKKVACTYKMKHVSTGILVRRPISMLGNKPSLYYKYIISNIALVTMRFENTLPIVLVTMAPRQLLMSGIWPNEHLSFFPRPASSPG